MDEHTCSSGCKMPPEMEPTPLFWRVVWRTWGWVTWPYQARQLHKAGFRRVGWRRWE